MVAIVAAAVVVTIAATMDAVAVVATKKEAISIYYGLQTENKIQERIKTVCSPFYIFPTMEKESVFLRYHNIKHQAVCFIHST